MGTLHGGVFAFLRVADRAEFGFEVFGQEAIGLEQALAREADFVVADLDVARGLLVGERGDELVERIDAELLS